MKKSVCLSALLLMLILSCKLYALSIGVIEPDSLKGILTNDLRNLWFDNAISFEEITELDTDCSAAEMTLHAQRSGFAFIIYGFLEKDDSKCSAELRLLNVDSRKTDKFFYASDELDSIPRLSKTLASHIHEYLCERFSINETEFKRFYKLDLTLSGGYWTYTYPTWADLFLGIVNSRIGMEFHPALDFKFRKNDTIDFSIAFNAGYRYGKGKDDRYNALFHGTDFSLPIMFNWNPTEIHSLKFGIGPAFQLGFVKWTPLYEDEEMKKIYQWGITSFIEGRVFLTRKFGFSMGVGGTYYFINKNVPEFSANIGVVFTPCKKAASR